MRIVVILVFLLLLPSVLHSKTIELRTPPDNKYGDYVKAVLTEAYRQMDHEINFIDIPGAREIILANKSEIAGLLARDPVFEEKHPNVVRVNVPLFQYQILLYSDRRICGYCLVQDIKGLVYPRHGVIYNQMAAKFSNYIDKISVGGYSDMEALLFKQRVSTAIMSSMQISKKIEDSPHFVKRVLATRDDFHYLSKEYAYLKEPLERVLLEMSDSGKLSKLRRQYKIDEWQEPDLPFPNEVLAVSGFWTGYTEDAGKGTYRQMLKLAFGHEVNVNTKATTWTHSVNQFKDGKADMLVGAYKNSPSTGLSSELHIDYEYDVVAIARDKAHLERLNTGDQEMRVCVPESYELLIQQFGKGNNIYPGEINTCKTLFDNNEVQVIVHYPYHLEQYGSEYVRKTIFKSAPLFVMFQNNAKGLKLKSVFDRKLEQLARKGELKKLFKNDALYRAARITEVSVN